MSDIHTTSTSSSSAKVDEPLVLREGPLTRLVFLPEIVDNAQDETAPVRGRLLWQKKGMADDWEDWKDVPLKSMKKGEGVVFELKAGEVKLLHERIGELYALYEDHGVPMGTKTFIEASPDLSNLANMTHDELEALANANQELGAAVLVKLLKWASGQEKLSAVVDGLSALSPSALAAVTTMAGIESLKQARKVWDAYLGQPGHKWFTSEENWQKTFMKHQFLIEHLFAHPVALVAEKAYVGGKSIHNKDGNIVDFLLKNDLTHNAVILEIKTPGTELLGPEYRLGLPNVSKHLAGSVLQALDYRSSFTHHWIALNAAGAGIPTSVEPPCVVIIGTAAQLDTPDKKKSFELFRRRFDGVTILTFDEVFERSNRLLKLLTEAL